MAFSGDLEGFGEFGQYAPGDGTGGGTLPIGPALSLVGAGIKVGAGGEVTGLIGPGFALSGAVLGSIIPGVGTVIGGMVGSVVGGIVGSLFGGGDAEKAARDAEGRAAIQKLNADVLANAAKGYEKYTVAYLERMWQLARPDEMKTVITALLKKGHVVTDKEWAKIWPYVSVIESIVVLRTVSYFKTHASVTEYHVPFEDMFDNIRSYLSKKGVDYPTSDELALNIVADKPTIALTYFLSQLQKQYEAEKQRALIDLEIDNRLQSYGLVQAAASPNLQPIYNMVDSAYHDTLNRSPTSAERSSWAYNLISGVDEMSMRTQLQLIAESGDPEAKTTVDAQDQIKFGLQTAGMSTTTMLLIAGIGMTLLFSRKK